MKYLKVVILVFIMQYSAVWSDWTLIDSLDWFNIHDFKCYDSVTCVAIGMELPGYPPEEHIGDRQASVARLTTDGGISWKEIFVDSLNKETNHAPVPYTFVALPEKDHIYMIGERMIIQKSTDAGKTWTSIKMLDSITDKKYIPSSGFVWHDKNFGITKMIPTKGQFKLTTDGGLSWADRYVPEKYQNHILYNMYILKDSTILIDLVDYKYLLDTTIIILKSKDMGLTFSITEGPRCGCYGSHIYNDSLMWLYGFTIRNDSNEQRMVIFKSTDLGETWVKQFEEHDGSASINSVKFSNPNDGIALNSREEIRLTSDGGETWQKFKFNNPPKNFGLFNHVEMFSPNLIYLADQTKYIYKYNHSTTSVLTQQPEIKDILLFPNPLPSGSELTLEFTLAAASDVRIELTDMLGRSVGEAYSGYMDAGRRTLRYKPEAELPAGMYFLKLSAGGSVYVGKLVITK